MAMGRGELSPQDFKTTKNNWIQYTKKNNIRLPQGSYTDFEWKDYCPAVFRFSAHKILVIILRVGRKRKGNYSKTGFCLKVFFLEKGEEVLSFIGSTLLTDQSFSFLTKSLSIFCASPPSSLQV